MKTLTSFSFVMTTVVLSGVYLAFITLSMNAGLVIDTIFGSFPFGYKINLIIALLQGMWTAMGGGGLVLLFLTAVLTGANLTLLWRRISTVKRIQNLHIVVGGNSLFGIMGSGCVACGLPILSLLGISGSVLYLPLRGLELSYLAVAFLSFSLILLVRGNTGGRTCAVSTTKNYNFFGNNKA